MTTFAICAVVGVAFLALGIWLGRQSEGDCWAMHAAPPRSAMFWEGEFYYVVCEGDYVELTTNAARGKV